ncbi:DUF2004 domain-containing protein [Diaminobutyricibacter tongyongensis]|uniref:DUF2004 domain-containing protein n=1 Tax=Leifsonia tongyongensis TaxID=1268043 RepID=A0A6L9XZ59_9MICO|nr:DUF2004 domain-containing protein [Diaminobutyricibacter tongyongensis]NEN06701.1 DUF2004 domain-containing protein [Diaminobutyricibacter tongyongensis]
MAIEHDFFGIIDETASGGLAWQDTVELGDQAVEIDLQADAESRVTGYALDSAAALLQALEGFDARARDALVAQLSDRASETVNYVDQQVDDMGESLLDLLVHNSGDLQVDVLRSLQLMRIALFPENSDEDDVFATFDYSISPDDTDAILIVSFDIRGDVVAVEMQG